MAHFVAYQAVDFTKLPELLILIQGPVFSEQSPTGFTATKDNVSLKVTGVNFQFAGGEPISGNIEVFEAFSEGNPTFRIEDQSFEVLQLVDRLTNGGIDFALDNILNEKDVLDGSASDDTLFGYDFADKLSGNKGDDNLDGGFANDILDGGKGRDTLFGGGDGGQGDGPDTFVFSAKAKQANADKVMDFVDGDLIHLDNNAFKHLKKEGPLKDKFFADGGKAGHGNDYVVYDESSGKLFSDKDGDGHAGQKLIATFKGKPDIDHDDIFVV